jgi:hypothetical protein
VEAGKSQKQNMNERVRGMAQVVQHFPSNNEALSLIPSKLKEKEKNLQILGDSFKDQGPHRQSPRDTFPSTLIYLLSARGSQISRRHS